MDSFLLQSLRIAAVITAYWAVSISLVFMNKYLLSSDDLKLDAPFFVTWSQCVVSVGICLLMRFVSKLFPSRIAFPDLTLNVQTMKQISPLSLVFVAMITFNNLCLKHVHVSFYHVGRSTTIIFNVFFSFLILGQKTSFKALMCCAVVIGGFFLGVDQENVIGSLSVIGVCYGVCASMCVALNSIYTKKFLAMVDQSIWRLTFYNNINACILFVPLMVIFGDISSILSFSKLYDLQFWGIMLAGGVFGFSIGYLTGLQIQVTTPLTHNMSGTAKACFQTVLATILYSESKPWMWWVGSNVVIFGSTAYTHVRRQEMKQQMLEDQTREKQKEVANDRPSEVTTRH